MWMAEQTWKETGSLMTREPVLLTPGLFRRREMSFHLAQATVIPISITRGQMQLLTEAEGMQKTSCFFQMRTDVTGTLPASFFLP